MLRRSPRQTTQRSASYSASYTKNERRLHTVRLTGSVPCTKVARSNAAGTVDNSGTHRLFKLCYGSPSIQWRGAFPSVQSRAGVRMVQESLCHFTGKNSNTVRGHASTPKHQKNQPPRDQPFALSEHRPHPVVVIRTKKCFFLLQPPRLVLNVPSLHRNSHNGSHLAGSMKNLARATKERERILSHFRTFA